MLVLSRKKSEQFGSVTTSLSRCVRSGRTPCGWASPRAVCQGSEG